MKHWRGILVLAGLTGFLAACQKSANNSPYPQISLISLTPDSLQAASSEDTAYILFKFFDGDGDLAVSQTVLNDSRFIVRDNRNGDSLEYDLPSIDPSLVDPDKGVEGTTLVKIQAAFLSLRPDTAHTLRDTTTFTFRVIDNAGHESNSVTTPRLILKK